MVKVAALQDVLSYRHAGVVSRYLKDHGGSPVEAEEIFVNLLAWLYLGARAAEVRNPAVVVSMYPELLKIDEMWHSFVLYTRDYAEFCQEHFGSFIHHEPADHGRSVAAHGSGAGLAEFLSFAYDELGEQTVYRWFVERRFAKPGSDTVPGQEA